MSPPFKKLLVANRSEIAIRVFRAATELGIGTVAIYAEEDKLSLHRFKADEAYQVGKGVGADKNLGPLEAYLSISEVIRVAKEAEVDAIHPGYGFLSESPEFADACSVAGIKFIGPSPQTMRTLGNKVSARNLAISVGVPVMPATEPLSDSADDIKKRAAEIGYPVMLKASWGGGGRGMRPIESEEGFSTRLLRASAKPRLLSARMKSISKNSSDAHAISRCRCSATRMALWCISSNAIVQFSGAIRKSSSVRRRPISTTEQRESLCDAALKIGRRRIMSARARSNF